MILTQKEKADRYDALQSAIKWELENREKFNKDLRKSVPDPGADMRAAFDYGRLTESKRTVEILERWV